MESIEELQKEISYLKADMDTRFTRRESMIFAIIGLLGFLAAVVGFFDAKMVGKLSLSY